jgi:hypothetical protein
MTEGELRVRIAALEDLRNELYELGRLHLVATVEQLIAEVRNELVALIRDQLAAGQPA